MCGIHGLITTDTYVTNGDDFIKDCFIANQVRGMHSSGIFQMDNKGDLSMLKKAMNGSEFVGLAEAKPFFDRVSRSRITVGHVRHRTSGEIKDANAHPFWVKREDGSSVIGVHNGSLRDWKNKKDSNGVDVDSEWAFQMLANEGHDAFEYFNGAFCFVWYDSRNPDVLNVARNDERPFHYMITKDRKSMLFASELGMLGWLSGRNKIEVGKADDGSKEFYLTKPGNIYQFSLKEIGKFSVTEYPKYDPTTSKTPPAVHSNYNSRYYPHGMYGMDWENDRESFGDAIPWDPYDRNAFMYDNSNDDSWDKRRMESIFKNVKLALREGRSLVYKDEMADTKSVEEDLDESIREALDAHRAAKKNKAASIGPFQVGSYITRPNSTSATRGELSRAEKLSVFGQLVAFAGVMYDDEQGVCEGTIQIVLDGKLVDRDAQLRNQTKTRAQHVFINSAKRSMLTVIGYIPPENPFPEQYVVAELDEDQRQLMKLMAADGTNH